MTVAELRAALTDKPDHARVVLEGCDCMGLANAVDPLDGDGLVVIRRTGGSGYVGRDALSDAEQDALYARDDAQGTPEGTKS